MPTRKNTLDATENVLLTLPRTSRVVSRWMMSRPAMLDGALKKPDTMISTMAHGMLWAIE